MTASVRADSELLGGRFSVPRLETCSVAGSMTVNFRLLEPAFRISNGM
jgi:hypothetical protein